MLVKFSVQKYQKYKKTAKKQLQFQHCRNKKN